MRNYPLFLLTLLGPLVGLLLSCSNPETAQRKKLRQHNLSVSSIHHQHDEVWSPSPKTLSQPRTHYPWESKYIHNNRRITKEFFRCRGHTTNPPIPNAKRSIYYLDCAGKENHSLPIKNGQEFIYPILIDLLNHIQNHTEKKVVVTCGHRCPIHHLYVDPNKSDPNSKHLIAAEVDFYVEGLEHHPYTIIDILQTFYDLPFQRSTQFTQAHTPSWYNKEVVITLYQPHEGRDLDNSHSYPYLSIQVRHDAHTNKPVNYNWHQAHRGYFKSSS